MTLYPALNTAEHTVDQSYRIQEVVRLRKCLEDERDKRTSLYKKYRRGANSLDGIDAALFATTAGLGVGGIALLSTVIMAPVALGLEVGALACGTFGAVSKLVSRQLNLKAKKHDEIRVLAESKLNSIASVVSAALQDGNISDVEFKMVLAEFDKYLQMKKEVRAPGGTTSGKKLDEEALLEQGRKEIRDEITKHMEAFSTLQKNSG